MAALATLLQRLQESEPSVWAWEGVRRKRHLIAPRGSEDSLRIATDDPALMRVIEPSSPVRWIVRITEVSRDRLLLVAQMRPEPGSFLQLHIQQTSLLARVAHASPLLDPERPGCYAVEVEIQHVF